MADMERDPSQPTVTPTPAASTDDAGRLQERLDEADPADAPAIAEELATRLSERLDGDQGTS